MKKYQRSLFLFRHDLRLVDNTGLIGANKSSLQTIPCFILDPKLLNPSNPKFSKFRFQFLQECLVDLDKQLQNKGSYLHILSGPPEKIVENLIDLLKVDEVFVNADYMPFSKKRDENIHRVCVRYNVDFIATDDLLLHDVEEIKTLKEQPYKVFTQFFRKSRESPVRKPQVHSFSNLSNQKIKLELLTGRLEEYFGENNRKPSVRGGRKSTLQLMDNLKNLKD